MIAKPLVDIVKADLLALIANRAEESRHLEFKRELPEPGDQGKGKFLKSVTAFANTSGGDVIYGMVAVEGVATSLLGLEVTSQDQVLQRLESFLSNGVDPRLIGVQFRWVPLTDGKVALVVRVPRSWNAPHRVIHSKEFFARNSSGAAPMDVTELRRAFALSGEIAQRIRAFRSDRLFAISSGQAQKPLQPGAVGVLHVIPLQAFVTDALINVASNSQALTHFHPLGSTGYDDRLNLDGRLAFRRDNNGRCFGYAQLHRNGIVEATDVYSYAGHQGEKFLPSLAYERDILRALGSYMRGLQALAVETPAYVFFSLVGIHGYRMGLREEQFFSTEQYVADRDMLDFPEVTILDWQCDAVALMRPMFDVVWNSFGLMRSFNYDEKGKWVGG